MKVKELIKELSKFDSELIICVEGYEGGFTERISLHIRGIELYGTASDLLHCFGEHKEIRLPKAKDEKALVITRGSY